VKKRSWRTPTNCDQANENVRMCDLVHVGSGMNVELNILECLKRDKLQ
jgi:hypothetical protein